MASRYDYLVQRLQHAHEMPQKRVIDIVKRLEEALFKTAATKVYYIFFFELFIHAVLLQFTLILLMFCLQDTLASKH